MCCLVVCIGTYPEFYNGGDNVVGEQAREPGGLPSPSGVEAKTG